MQNSFLGLALAIAVVLGALYVWSVWRGRFNRQFYSTSVVGILAVLALVLLYLQPAWSTKVSASAVLLTQGYDVAQLDSIKKEGSTVIAYASGINLSPVLDSISELTVLGQGVSAFDFWQLKEVSVNYLGGDLPRGIIKLNYPKQHRVGRELFVRGRYHQPVLGNSLVLQSASGVGLDSIVFDAEADAVFSLKMNPKSIGQVQYQLTKKDSTGLVLTTDPLPVTLLPKQVLRIFISNQFPSFETKYLKNFLAAEGHQVVVRSQITKNKHKFEYFNTDRKPVYGFSKQALTEFDLLILDADAFLSLPKSTTASLRSLIKEQGTGLFVQPNAALFSTSNTILNFDVKADGVDRVSILNNKKLLLEKYPYVFTDASPRGITIGEYSYGEVLGKGNVSTSLLHTTYQLVLDGNSDAYQEIWANILEATARAEEKETHIKTEETFAFKDVPHTTMVQTEEEKPIVMLDDAIMPLQKNSVLKDRWHGTTYPLQTGWQSVTMPSDTSAVMHYFVMDSTNWRPLQGAQTILENKRFFSNAKQTEKSKKQLVPISRWWFFLMFLCGMGYLWLVPKLKG